jgi:serine/threonine-protein kinase
VLRILRQMARGLREAHKLGAIHRDLKPSNVMLVPEADGGEIVKILDFGVGKLLGGPEDQALTQQGSFLGSPRYVAPEQVNEKRVDARTDVYALGVIAYEMLCGFVPFDRETNLETILAHCSAPLPQMSERNPAVRVPVILEAFVRKCLEKSPNDRPASMEEVLRCISDVERTLFGVTSLGASPNDLTPQIMPVPPPPAASRPEAFDDTLASSPQMVRAREPSIGTQSPLTSPATTSPGATVSGRAQQRAVIALIAAIVLGAGAAAAVATMRAGHPPPAATGAATATAIAPATTATSFTLVLESTPPGAEVLENDDLLGTTPMQVTIARAGVRSAPRRFMLRLDGYSPYTLLQGDSESIVHVVAPLAPAASALAPPHTAPLMSATTIVPASSAPTHAPAQRATTRSATSPAAPPQQDLDIKLTR